MHRVPQLECKHCICSHLTGLCSELARCESVFVQTIIPDNSSQHLHIPSRQPVTTILDHLDIRMTIIEHSKLSGTSFLLPVFIELWLSYDGFWFPLVAQGELLSTSQPLFILC